MTYWIYTVGGFVAVNSFDVKYLINIVLHILCKIEASIPSNGVTSDDFEGFHWIFFRPLDHSFSLFRRSLDSGGQEQNEKFFKAPMRRKKVIQSTTRCPKSPCLWGDFGQAFRVVFHVIWRLVMIFAMQCLDVNTSYERSELAHSAHIFSKINNSWKK